MTRRAVVLGGGGVAGIAWETGIVAGLAEAGVALLDADLILGTSAGSTVAAQITSELPLDELFRRQTDSSLRVPELGSALSQDELMELFGPVYAATTDPVERRRRIGAIALEAPTVPEQDRLDVIAARLPSHDWPDTDLKIVAVDVESGEEAVFDKASGVYLVDAVAASCAVPGVWPAVTINGRRYMDGGLRSSENADLAVGYERVIILQVTQAPGLDALAAEIDILRAAGAEVTVTRPDEAAKDAIGPNLLDPAVREASATAGHGQALRDAARLADFWS